MKKEDEEKKKRIEQISKHLHPHDDEPDPTAYMGNYNFPQMLFAFCLGAGTIFVAAVNEIDKFKGCPLPEYFRDAPRSTVRQGNYANPLVPWRHGVLPCVRSYRWNAPCP